MSRTEAPALFEAMKRDISANLGEILNGRLFFLSLNRVFAGPRFLSESRVTFGKRFR
jgi:hypothetical protein